MRTGSWTTRLLVPGNAQKGLLTRNQLHRPRGPAGTRCQGDTQVPGGHPSPTAAASGAGPTSDSEGRRGECWWEGLGPGGQGSGWALTSHCLSAQEAWTSLTVLKEGPDSESGAGSGVHSCAPWGTMDSGGRAWGAVGSQGRLAGQQQRGESMRPEEKGGGQWRAASTSRRNHPVGRRPGPRGPHMVAQTDS